MAQNSEAERQIRIVVGSAAVRGWPGIKRCFPAKEGYLLVNGAPAPEALLTMAQRVAPCVLIVDYDILKHYDPADFAGVVDFGRTIQALVYGGPKDEENMNRLVRMGCMGVIGPDLSGTQLRKAVRAVACGELWLDRRFVGTLVKQLLTAANAPKLTSREKGVLDLIAQGLSNRSIADKLCISHETVRWHIRTLHTKLGTQDRLSTAARGREYLQAGPNRTP